DGASGPGLNGKYEVCRQAGLEYLGRHRDSDPMAAGTSCCRGSCWPSHEPCRCGLILATQHRVRLADDARQTSDIFAGETAYAQVAGRRDTIYGSDVHDKLLRWSNLMVFTHTAPRTATTVTSSKIITAREPA